MVIGLVGESDGVWATVFMANCFFESDSVLVHLVVMTAIGSSIPAPIKALSRRACWALARLSACWLLHQDLYNSFWVLSLLTWHSISSWLAESERKKQTFIALGEVGARMGESGVCVVEEVGSVLACMMVGVLIWV